MYTRCPSCRAEISFEPPVNAASLPDGYKHKIKCPSCGVTIAVKIPRLENTVQPTFAPQNPNAVSPEPIYNYPGDVKHTDDSYADDVVDNGRADTIDYESEYDHSADLEKPAKVKKTRYGGAASAFAMIWALLLTGFFVVASLVGQGIIPESHSILANLGNYDVYAYALQFFNFDYMKEVVAEGNLNIFWGLAPIATALFAFIHLIVSFSYLCAGKYPKSFKAFNAVWSFFLFAGATLSMLWPVMAVITAADFAELGISAGTVILEFLKGLADNGAWLALVVAPALGFILFLTALISISVKNPDAPAKERA